MLDSEKTIAAIATPPGTGGVCVIRISGRKARSIGEAVTGITTPPRNAVLCDFHDHAGAVIDQGLLLYFPNPHSFTGEDVVELQGHGGVAVAQAILQATLDAGARLAGPGEFTERAFLNDKIDLAQAEAIADLIDARSQDAVRAANRSLQGEFSKQVTVLADRLLKLRMYIEAALDFPEEEIDFLSEGHIEEKLEAWGADVAALLATARQGRIINDGINLVLAGKPNAGKSSLLNALLGEDRAIVTAQAGTTRDIVRESLVIDGIPVNVLDTAGLRDSEDIAEKEGIRRSHQAISEADIVLLMVDGTTLTSTLERDAISALKSELGGAAPQAKCLVIYNKSDIASQEVQAGFTDGLWLSAKAGIGLEALKRRISQLAGREERQETVFIARERHVRALEATYQHYQNAIAQMRGYRAAELVAEDLKAAHDSLGEITGKISSDDLLGQIFSGFCIGK